MNIRGSFRNPAAVNQPKFKVPIPMGRGIGTENTGSRNRRKGKDKGNLPYLRFRRRLRKNMFGKML